MRLAQDRFSFFASNALRSQINQHDVTLGATAHNAQTALCERFGHDLGVLDDLLLVGLETRSHGFFEGNSFGSNDVHERAALQAREDSAVDGFFVLGFHQDDAAARSAQALVGGRCHYVGVRHGVGINTCRNETCIVRHINQKNGANIFGHFGKACKVNVQTVGRCASNDELGF